MEDLNMYNSIKNNTFSKKLQFLLCISIFTLPIFHVKLYSNDLNPSRKGEFSYQRIVYASPDLDYGNLATEHVKIDRRYYSLPPIYALNTYEEYDSFSDPVWQTSAIDLQNLYIKEVPLNGVFYLPDGDGPFPLVVLVHGRYYSEERSDLGFEYICSFLASHGIITATVDMNDFNKYESYIGRSLMTLEHVKQFKTWNFNQDHPLYKKVDLDNIMLMGHSRGGQAVAMASQLNSYTKKGVVEFHLDANDEKSIRVDGSEGLGPYKFNFKGIVAVAPTDKLIENIPNPDNLNEKLPIIVKDNYFLIAGSRDCDLKEFDGQKTYERSLPFDPIITQDADGTLSKIKSLLYVHGANHNYFNSAWSLSPDGSGRSGYGIHHNTQYQIPPELQQEILLVYLSSIVQGFMLDREQYIELLRIKDDMADALGKLSPEDFPIRNHISPNDLASTKTKLKFNFTLDYQDSQRLIINNYEEDRTLSTVSYSNSGENKLISDPTEENSLPVIKIAEIKNRENNLLDVVWNSPGGKYVVEFPSLSPLSPRTDDGVLFPFFALRAGLPTKNVMHNKSSVNQAFSIEIVDADGNNFSVSTDELSQYDLLPYPQYMSSSEAHYHTPQVVLQTIRVPVSIFSEQGVNIDAIQKIILRFDKTQKGRLYIDDLQFTY
jgi:hypothetical protein